MFIDDLDIHHCNRRHELATGPENWFRIKVYIDGEINFGFWPIIDGKDDMPEGEHPRFLKMNSADVRELASMLLSVAEVAESDKREWDAREAAAEEAEKRAKKFAAENPAVTGKWFQQ